jgi:perosamine synthetase
VNTRSLHRRISEREYALVREVLDGEFRSSTGSVMMSRFEEAFCRKLGIAYAISEINGTATMHSLLEAIGVGPGDEVIVPPLTMSSTAFVVLQANATPVFADVDPDTFVISAPAIEKCLTEKTRAIITVSLYGLSPDLDPIMTLARRHGLTVIEDDAQCLLGTYKGRTVGTIGHASSFSFQSSKHITAGEGGMVATNDLELAQKVRRVSSLGYAGVDAKKGKIRKSDIQEPSYSRHVSMGWNYRMPELCAAVLLGQLEHADELIQRRTEVAALFQEASRRCSWLVPQKVGPDYGHVYWTWTVRIDNARVSWNSLRDRFMERGGHGIYGAWKLTYLEPMFREKSLLGRDKFISAENLGRYTEGACPVAEGLQPRILQFKTNYWNWQTAEEQAAILQKTLDSFAGT